jgi:hypothetical protein
MSKIILMTKKNPKNLFDFDDILIQPEIITNISSRSDITPYYVGEKLPLMTAPMDTVIDENNFIHFNKVGITPILPRIKNPDYDYVDTNLFLSYSISNSSSLRLNLTSSSASRRRHFHRHLLLTTYVASGVRLNFASWLNLPV